MRTPRISLATAAVVGFGTIGFGTIGPAAGPAHAEAGTTLFVDNASGGCSDQTTDSSAHAYCSIHAAVAAVRPGQTVQIAGGPYVDSLNITAQGTADAPITITAAPGVTVSVGPDASATPLAQPLDFEHASYVTVTGLRFTAAATNRGVIVNDSSHITLMSDIVIVPAGVVVTGSDDTTVARDLVASGWGDGVVVAAGSTGTTVSTTQITSRGHGVLVENASGTMITGVTADGTCSAGVEVENSTGTTVENSILGVSRLIAGSCRSAETYPGDLSVAADSVATTHARYNLLDPVAPGGTVYRWGSQTFAQAADFQAATGEGTRDLVTAPMLDGNGRPVEGSPAIDSADSAAVGEQGFDYLGHARVLDPHDTPTGGGPRSYDDRGAVEFTDPFAISHLTTVQDGKTFTATLAVQTTGWYPVSEYTFDFGDGHPVTQASPTITHAFTPVALLGDQHPTVTVTATESVTGTQRTNVLSTVLTYSAATPNMATPTNTAGTDGFYSLGVDASGSMAGTSPIASYTLSVDNNDPNYSFSRTVTQASPNLSVDGLPPGDYKLDLTVTDSLGLTATQEIADWGVSARPPGSVTVHRIAGADRYTTGVAVSQRLWADAAGDSSGRRTADAVVLATGAGFADAVTGVPLAAKANGPLLLTEPDALTPSTETEITRILPANQGKTVYVLGGTNAISTAVDSRLQALGYTVVRFAGADRFATSVEIAEQEFPGMKTAYLATGLDYPDALAAGPLAAANGAPVVLVDGTHLGSAASGYLDSQTIGFVTTIGGGADRALYGFPHVNLSGATRYDTAAAVAAAFPQHSAITSAGVATGTGYADALTGGAMMATLGQPLLLTDPATLPGQDGTLLTQWVGLKDVSVFGGTGAVGDGVVNQIVAVVRGRIV